MLIETRLFGDVDIEQEKIICFENGIIGFPDMKRFAMIANEEDDRTSHIYWLQSVEEKEFAIPVIDPLLVKADYNPVVEDELLNPVWGLDDTEISVFVTITVVSDIEKMTVNLKAPIIINPETARACQVIVEDETCPIRYPIYDALVRDKEKAGE